MEKTVSRRNFLKKSSKIIAATGLSGCGILLKGCTSKKDFDLIIQGGRIYDGSGKEAVQADIGINGNFIKEIGKISNARGKSVIDAKDLTVCPGFIDVHDHTDVELLVNPKAESSIRQGITTLVSGNCGSSPFPIAEEIYDETKENLKEQLEIDLTWMDINGFFSRLDEKGMALNFATLVGQGTIRGASMGSNDRPPKQEELERMKVLVDKNIKAGAVGLSTGLEYAPGCYAQPDEITELCTVAAQLGGVYATHMRDEGDSLFESLEETIEVARKAGISLQISHFKICYPRNWHKIDQALVKIEEAKKEGISIFCDRYPYIASSTGLSFYFPRWAKQGTTDEFLARLKDPPLNSRLRAYVAEQEKKLGSWEKVIISSVASEENRNIQGKSVWDAAKELEKEPYDFMKDLLIEEKNRVGMVAFNMKEENLRRILAHPLVGIGTDGSAVSPYGLLGRGKPHPRNYGTFPRVLGKYIREEKIMALSNMIKKMTSVVAEKFSFEKRGMLRNGYFADIVIFDDDTVVDRASWTDPHQYPVGIEYVLVNGEIVIERGEHTGNLPGKILRKKIEV
ncbi:MAG: D-aminoacylase [Candidatus Aminicenantes bacterium]|nr:MAG: D-aminoacylase [Candidatus Aminicenantes bacterium]